MARKVADFLSRPLFRSISFQLIELKNGETYNGHLVNCDTWMNVHLREVICTSKDGDRFWRMPECYIRGNTVKYMRVQEEVMEKAVEEQKKFRRYGQGRGKHRARRRHVEKQFESDGGASTVLRGSMMVALSAWSPLSLSLSLSLAQSLTSVLDSIARSRRARAQTLQAVGEGGGAAAAAATGGAEAGEGATGVTDKGGGEGRVREQDRRVSLARSLAGWSRFLQVVAVKSKNSF